MLKDSSAKTLENLKEAFAGESQANRKYLAFAAKADKEGYSQVARLFRAAADAETVHALAHLKAMLLTYVRFVLHLKINSKKLFNL